MWGCQDGHRCSNRGRLSGIGAKNGDPQWACLCGTLCSRQLEQLSLEPPGAQGPGFQCEDWPLLEGVPRSLATLWNERKIAFGVKTLWVRWLSVPYTTHYMVTWQPGVRCSCCIHTTWLLPWMKWCLVVCNIKAAAADPRDSCPHGVSRASPHRAYLSPSLPCPLLRKLVISASVMVISYWDKAVLWAEARRLGGVAVPIWLASSVSPWWHLAWDGQQRPCYLHFSTGSLFMWYLAPAGLCWEIKGS